MLTPKQYKLLLHIQEQTAQNGYAPSYDEMRDAMGLRSKSGIHRLVCALETRGYIRRLPNKARAIEIVHNSGQAALPSAQAMPQGIAQGIAQGTPTATYNAGHRGYRACHRTCQWSCQPVAFSRRSDWRQDAGAALRHNCRGVSD